MSGNLVGALKIKSNFVGHLKHPSVLVVSPNPERTRQGNHFSLITSALRAAPQGPGLFMADIRHDNWCAIFCDRPCDCDPDLDIKRANPMEYSNDSQKRSN